MSLIIHKLYHAWRKFNLVGSTIYISCYNIIIDSFALWKSNFSFSFALFFFIWGIWDSQHFYIVLNFIIKKIQIIFFIDFISMDFLPLIIDDYLLSRCRVCLSDLHLSRRLLYHFSFSRAWVLISYYLW